MRINPVTAFVLTAVLFGAGLAVHEKREDATPKPVQPARVSSPTPRFLMPQTAAQGLPTPGPGVWYEGWQFSHKSVCIDSSIAGAPLAAVAAMYTGANKGGLTVRFSATAGGCKALGYGEGQRVTFTSMSPYGQKHYGACAVTEPDNFGDLTKVSIAVWVTGPRATLCGDFASGEWVDVFAHEFGHATGLSHDQPAITSVMRDGHGLDAGDRKRLNAIYAGRRT